MQKIELLKVWDNSDTENQEPLLQKIARTSYKKDELPTTEDGASEFLRHHVLSRGHTTLIEHAWIIIEVERWFYTEIMVIMPNIIRQQLNIYDSIIPNIIVMQANLLTWKRYIDWLGEYSNDKYNLLTEYLNRLFPTIIEHDNDIFVEDHNLLSPETCVKNNLVAYTFRITGASRGFTHELVRHRRNIVFTQQSTRYVDESNFNFIGPPSLSNFTISKNMRYEAQTCLGIIRDCYFSLLEEGMPKQDARQYLPIGIEAPIVMTCTHEELEYLFKMRLEGISGSPHWEIKSIFQKIKNILDERN